MAGSKANGTEIGSVTQNISQNGTTTTTGRGLDAAIDGRGNPHDLINPSANRKSV